MKKVNLFLFFILVQDITSKWRTIRDNYTRNLKKQDECNRSGSAAKKIRQYVYGEQLSFLRKTKELRNTDSSYATTEEDGVDNFDEIEHDSVTCVDDGINNSNIDMEITATSSNEKSTSKRKKPNVEHALIDFMESHKASKKTSDNDEDLAFFYSLLPSVKSLTTDQKFEFRMQTMQLLQNLRTPEHNKFYNTSSTTFNKTPANFRPTSSSSALSYYSQFSSDELSNEYTTMENISYLNPSS